MTRDTRELPALHRVLLCAFVVSVVAGCGGSKTKPQSSPRLLDAIASDEIVSFGPEEDETVLLWEFDEDDVEGWYGSGHVAGLTARGGRLEFEATGNDPFVAVEGFEIDASQANRLIVDIKVDRFTTKPMIYWKTADQTSDSPWKGLHFDLPRKGDDEENFSRIEIPLADCAQWKGTITGLRVDPTDVPGARISIRDIELVRVPVKRARRTEVVIGPEWRRSRIAPVGDDWRVAVRVEGASTLDLGFAAFPYSAGRSSSTLRFRVDLEGKKNRTLLDESVSLAEAARFVDRTVALTADDASSGVVTLRLRVDGDTASDPSSRDAGVWTEPMLLATPPSSDAAPMNVLMISLDTLRADHLGCYDYDKPTSPNIDAVAASGVRFKNASAPAPETLASHMTLMTGRIPSAHGVVGDLNVLPDGYATIASRFLDHGHLTAAFTEGGYIGGHFGFRQGFQRYHDGEGTAPDHPGGDLEGTFGRARAWLDHYGDRPFFLFVHTYEIHVPYGPPEEYRRFGPEEYDGQFLGKVIDHREHVIPINMGALETDERDRLYIEGLYDAEIAFTDHEVGRLMKHLDTLGIADRTMVVILSDHGEEFGEHGAFAVHGHTLYEDQVRVPLIVRGPGMRKGATESREVALYDLFPTFGEMFDLPLPEMLDGESLTPLLDEKGEGGPSEGRSIIMEDGTIYVPRMAIRKDGLKYIRTDGVEEWWVTEILRADSPQLVGAFLNLRETELYDFVADPGERNDLSTTRRDAVEAFGREADRRWKAAAAAIDEFGSPVAGSVGSAAAERLEAIGYMLQSSPTITVEEVRKAIEEWRKGR